MKSQPEYKTLFYFIELLYHDQFYLWKTGVLYIHNFSDQEREHQLHSCSLFPNVIMCDRKSPVESKWTECCK